MGKTSSALKYCRVVGLQVIPVENCVRKVLFEVHRGERFLLRSGKEEKFDLRESGIGRKDAPRGSSAIPSWSLEARFLPLLLHSK